MGRNSRSSDESPTQDQDNAGSNDPGSGRQAEKSEPVGAAPDEKSGPDDAPNEATTEEFREEGMGIAAKE